ncbi:cysteine--tRNA ligase [Pseudoxanthobacter sp. M-2]|uniref:cysteine--tRNA ligase n=1 Tax=Pseudoxanthobacter sp. M-2 TaxID=3078754 RepID=UPI0038FD36DB
MTDFGTGVTEADGGFRGLRLYDTLTKEKRDIRPIDWRPEAGVAPVDRHVRMYVCGPTVYDFAHIGNARPVIVFDVLFRLLRHLYGEGHVKYVRNITDVDDKINARAAREHPELALNEAIRRVTTLTEQQFHEDVAALGCLPPTVEPRATDHIEEMRAIVERLVARGNAYVAEGHVLFDVASMPGYGRLARRSLDEMLAGARVDVAPYKKGPMDFVLWKPSKQGEPGWPSPAGIAVAGRPGWHLECSAMSMAELLAPYGGGLTCDDPLKNTFDIHGGGIDLVFPHHENEIAQSCCALGTPAMAETWMHNGFLMVEGEKMSKSLGNFVTIRQVLADWPGDVVRLTMLKTHYRQPIDWTVKGLKESEKTLRKWRDAIRRNGFAPPAALPGGFLEYLSDDLNTHGALGEMHRFGFEGNRGHRGEPHADAASADAAQEIGAGKLIACADFLGIELRPEAAAASPAAGVNEAMVAPLIEARLAARRARDFAEADRLRAELAALGIALKDGKDPATGEPVTTWEVAR